MPIEGGAETGGAGGDRDERLGRGGVAVDDRGLVGGIRLEAGPRQRLEGAAGAPASGRRVRGGSRVGSISARSAAATSALNRSPRTIDFRSTPGAQASSRCTVSGRPGLRQHMQAGQQRARDVLVERAVALDPCAVTFGGLVAIEYAACAVGAAAAQRLGHARLERAEHAVAQQGEREPLGEVANRAPARFRSVRAGSAP